MVSGGARVRSGPAPDPNALARERDGGQWVILPPMGRVGPPPQWPLTEQSERERYWWVRLWATPQASQWEKLGQVVEVAIYTRRLAAAEQPDAPVNLGTLLRQLADALGLTIPGMLRLRWHLGGVSAAPTPAPAPARARPAVPSSRGRFKVVRGEEADRGA